MYEKLPKELKENAMFCLWKYEERDGNMTKVLEIQRISVPSQIFASW